MLNKWKSSLTMKVRFGGGLRVVALALATLVVVTNAEAKHQHECAPESLDRAYGYFFSGSAADLRPVAAVGLAIFDGDGNVSVKDTLNTNGKILRRSGTGNYQVNTNCTGSVAVAGDFGQFSFDFMIIPESSGAEFSLIVTNPGAIQTGEAIGVGGEECTLDTLRGTYRQSGFTPPGPRSASVGFRIADGNGNYYGEDTQSINGAIGHRTVVATYTVNPDCTGTSATNIGGGANFDSVYVARGSQKFDLRADPGFISLGIFKREERRHGREDEPASSTNRERCSGRAEGCLGGSGAAIAVMKAWRIAARAR